ncbi:hypothetical protein SAMN06265371_101292 [Lutibacter agarilyticus]|uniref:Uncharacterized protein n=1 Tax=Lutibacter agarilyticus TaxID=1109740 RepID=A0A238VED8_9FLAO|nr:hypothetical protein [Lutibacter agarilyticus]SNR32616.1 hypothetical protein SAMN06265371_101292 [Lutibacter agarilyticus]
MKEIKNLVFELQKTQLPNYEECHNFLGFDTIEILAFNYDGQGNALVLENGEISYMNQDELRFLFYAGWYKLIKDGAN